MDNIPQTPLNRLISRQRPWWANILIGISLLLLPALMVTLDRAWQDILSRGIWRPLLMPMVVIFYILALAPIVDRNQRLLLARFRPIILINDDQVDVLVQDAGRGYPAAETASIVAGMVISFTFTQPWLLIASPSWTEVYWALSLAVMFGLLGLMTYGSIIATRLTAALHKQPLRVDIFDPSSFEPIGRQSMILAIAFIGGILLGMLFSLSPENIFAWQTWLTYLTLAMIAVLVFFLNMRDTHRILTAEKKRHMDIVAERLYQASLSMQTHLASGKALGQLAEELNALTAYEARLRTTRTWPYNTSMLRALFFTILLPVLTRLAGYLLF